MNSSLSTRALLGDSLTEYFPLEQHFAGEALSNWGLAGDTLRGALSRLELLLTGCPAKIFVLLGINDLNQGQEAAGVLANYQDLIQRFKSLCPATKLYIESVLPVASSRPYSTIVNQRVRALNRGLQRLADTYQSHYLNLYPLFETQGALNPALSTDGLHLNEAGYRILAEALRPYL